MQLPKRRSFFQIAVIFFALIVFGTIVVALETGAKFTDLVVTTTALIGVFAVYVESRRGKNIAMGEFILNLSSEFDENPHRAMIHQKIIAGDRLTSADKPAIVAYLTFFEIVYRLIGSDVVRIDVIDDLFRSRFFKAAHHVDIQNLELLPDADGYRNVYELERLWLRHLERAGNDLNRGERRLPESAFRRSAEQVHFSFSEATAEDVDEIHDVVARAAEGVPAGHFVVNDVDTIARQMDSGFTLMAHRGGDLAGILHVYFPAPEESYAERVGDEYSAAEVAHMDIAAVLPGHRGYGLLELLLVEAEAHLREAEPKRIAYYATVHPENGASKRSFEFSGYQAIRDLKIHGTYPRIVFRKEID